MNIHFTHFLYHAISCYQGFSIIEWVIVSQVAVLPAQNVPLQQTRDWCSLNLLVLVTTPSWKLCESLRGVGAGVLWFSVLCTCARCDWFFRWSQSHLQGLEHARTATAAPSMNWEASNRRSVHMLIICKAFGEPHRPMRSGGCQFEVDSECCCFDFGG